MTDDVLRTIPAVLALFDRGLRLQHMTDAWWRESAGTVGRPRADCFGAHATDLYANGFEHDPALLEQYERAARGECISRPAEAWPAPEGFAVIQTKLEPWRDGAKVLGCCVTLDVQRRIEPTGPMSALFIAACRANLGKRGARRASTGRR